MGAYECCYIARRCDHPECGAYNDGFDYGPEPPAPTVEEYCGAAGHGYAGDDGPPPHGRGRCYCGEKSYPLGGEAGAPLTTTERKGDE